MYLANQIIHSIFETYPELSGDNAVRVSLGKDFRGKEILNDGEWGLHLIWVN